MALSQLEEDAMGLVTEDLTSLLTGTTEQSKEEIAKITEPKTEIEFIASGVLVLN